MSLSSRLKQEDNAASEQKELLAQGSMPTKMLESKGRERREGGGCDINHSQENRSFYVEDVEAEPNSTEPLNHLSPGSKDGVNIPGPVEGATTSITSPTDNTSLPSVKVEHSVNARGLIDEPEFNVFWTSEPPSPSFYGARQFATPSPPMIPPPGSSSPLTRLQPGLGRSVSEQAMRLRPSRGQTLSSA